METRINPRDITKLQITKEHRTDYVWFERKKPEYTPRVWPLSLILEPKLKDPGYYEGWYDKNYRPGRMYPNMINHDYTKEVVENGTKYLNNRPVVHVYTRDGQMVVALFDTYDEALKWCIEAEKLSGNKFINVK